MQITELVWNLFLILLPGVVSTLMVRYISTNRNYSIFTFIIYSASLGIGVFVIMELFVSLYWMIVGLLDCSVETRLGLNLSIWQTLFNDNNNLNSTELFLAYILSIPTGLLWGVIIGRKYVLRVFKFLNLTHRYGDNDVWSFFLNSPDIEWIYVHDLKENKTFFGRIRAFSDSEEKREIVLEDVSVFVSNTWTLLYESNAVYLEFKSHSFRIEEPKKQ